MSGLELANLAAKAGCKIVHEDDRHYVIVHLELKLTITLPNVKKLAQDLIKKVCDLLNIQVD